jgi:hypothetical protein
LSLHFCVGGAPVKFNVLYLARSRFTAIQDSFPAIWINAVYRGSNKSDTVVKIVHVGSFSIRYPANIRCDFAAVAIVNSVEARRTGVCIGDRRTAAPLRLPGPSECLDNATFFHGAISLSHSHH